jgi:hypothetical protein
MKQKEQVGKYMEVWGDTIVPKELAISAIICVITTMVFFLVGRNFLLGIESLTPALAKGYALLVGICGTFLGAVICAKKFKPKRKIMIDFQEENIEDILKAAGMTVEEEREALRTVSPEVIKEMEDLELYSLLALIPEDSANYKPEYKEKAKEVK